MSDLITRLEALTGPCRLCDCLIENALGLAKFERDPRVIYGDADYNRVEPKPYTASIDAAMTLLPEGWWLAGLCFHHVVFRSAHDSAWGAEFGGPVKWVTYDGYPEPDFPIANGQAATPAIALCIAALKAKAKS